MTGGVGEKVNKRECTGKKQLLTRCVCVLFMFMTYSTQTYIKTVVNMLVLCPYDLLQIVFRLIFC